MRVSVRTLRRSRLSPPPEEDRKETAPSPSPQSTKPERASRKEATHGHEDYCLGDGGDGDSTDNFAGPGGGDSGGGGGDGLSTTTPPVEDKQGGAARVTVNSQRGNNYARDRDLSPRGDSSRGGSGRQNVSSRGTASGSELPTVTPCTCDIWAWALIILEMFSDESCLPDSGQV